MNRLLPALLSALLVLLLAGLPACGKKDWPSPQKAEDVFAFENVTGTSSGGCLNAAFTVSGGSQFLTGLALLIENPDRACQQCPFRPTERVELALTDPRVRLFPDTVSIAYCGLDPAKSYRFQVQGLSSMRGMPLVSSRVLP